jgi:hypothetical protein
MPALTRGIHSPPASRQKRHTDAQDDARDATPFAARATELRRVIRTFQVAMTNEQMPADVIKRVVNRIVYGDPCGFITPGQVHENAEMVMHVHIPPGAPDAAVGLAQRAAAFTEMITR